MFVYIFALCQSEYVKRQIFKRVSSSNEFATTITFLEWFAFHTLNGFIKKQKLTLNVFKQLIIHEKSCFWLALFSIQQTALSTFYVPFLFPPSLKTSTPRVEDLVTRPFCPKIDQMSPNSGKHHWANAQHRCINTTK